MPSHRNRNHCEKCQEILDEYPGVHKGLLQWFELLRRAHPEAHISCAGRGMEEQLNLRSLNRSRADWGESAHNWNTALDLFVLLPGSKEIYNLEWFNAVIGPRTTEGIEWYGAPGSQFWELPHIEVANWPLLVMEGKLDLVEFTSQTIAFENAKALAKKRGLSARGR